MACGHCRSTTTKSPHQFRLPELAELRRNTARAGTLCRTHRTPVRGSSDNRMEVRFCRATESCPACVQNTRHRPPFLTDCAGLTPSSGRRVSGLFPRLSSACFQGRLKLTASSVRLQFAASCSQRRSPAQFVSVKIRRKRNSRLSPVRAASRSPRQSRWRP